MTQPMQKKEKVYRALRHQPAKLGFDMLSEVALENIVRKLSNKPRSEEWQNYVEHQDIENLLNLEGGIPEAAGNVF